MRKFLAYSLGVLSSLSSTAAIAVEKFEILPDLPEPLAYATQPVHASTISGSADIASLGAQTIGQEPSIVSVVLSLLIVIFLIYVTGIIYAKLNRVGFKTLKKQQGELARSQVSVISTTQLGSNKTLHVVELDGKRMLIGASTSTIQLIKDLGSITNSEDEEYSHIEIPNIKIPKIEIPKIEIPAINFSKLSTKTHKPIKEVEKEEKTNNTENIINEKEAHIETENSVEIIDSLFAQQGEPIEEVMPETKSEHVVDPEDFTLYKKYLG